MEKKMFVALIHLQHWSKTTAYVSKTVAKMSGRTTKANRFSVGLPEKVLSKLTYDYLISSENLT